MITAKEWKRRLLKLGYAQRPRPERRVPSGLLATYGSDSAPKLGIVEKISSTGLFLQTDERWPIGEAISLTLQREGPPETVAGRQIDVQARVASHGANGVGLGFVLPAALDLTLWGLLIQNVDTLTETEDIQFMSRMVRTILFLCRLCPAGAEEAILLLGEEMDKFRAASMIDIALTTEKMLASEPDADHMHAHPHIVASIVKNGSWAVDDLSQHLWAGLLTSSCSIEGSDESNQDFVELLVQVTATQARILTAGCRKALALMSGTDKAPSHPVIVTPAVMIQISGLYDLYRSATDVAYLFHFGLIERNFDFTTYLPKDDFDITPSRLGLDLFRACRGHLLPAAISS